jgi:PAS domain S-box-containing protein
MCFECEQEAAVNTRDLDEYWRTVVNTIQDGVMIVDTKGRIVSVNSALSDITGYAREELAGASCAIINCTSCELARGNQGRHWCAMFQKGALRCQRCAVTRKDGRVVHVVKNASVLKDAAGTVIGAVETMTDVSELVEKQTQIEIYRRELRAQDAYHGLIGRSPAMFQAYDMIGNAARSDGPVIICGESGTGKELAARAVHEASSRAGRPFIKVNCAALSESLLESELFGHVKGAYTGAHSSRAGRFEAAGDGDIFLDEIGDMPLTTQVKLLRVIEERVVERVGDQQPIPVAARLISATNRDLTDLVARGAFRRDFYYRVNVIPVRMPSLRERKEDIPLLAEAFFRRIKLKYGDKNIQGISRETMAALAQYSWPGNVRELKSAFEYAFIACRGDVLEPRDLPHDITGAQPASPAPSSLAGDLGEIKKQRLIQALQAAGGNQSEAAKALGISRTTIWSQLKRFGLKA